MAYNKAMMLFKTERSDKRILATALLTLACFSAAIVAWPAANAQQPLATPSAQEYRVYFPGLTQHGPLFRAFLPLYVAGTSGTFPPLSFADASGLFLHQRPGFVTCVGEGLQLDRRPYTFVGINVSYLAGPFFPEGKTEEIISFLAATGVQVIRVWVKPGCALDRVERMLDLGGRYGIRFILTLQDFYGKEDGWWFKEKYKTVDLPHIRKIVPRFAHRPEIVMWELMNEPTCPPNDANRACWDALYNWAKATSEEVKRLDSNHLVSLGTHRAGLDRAAVDSFLRIHALPTVDVISMHHGVGQVPEEELSIAHELGKPIYWGEATMRGLKEDCQPISPDRLEQRALAVGEAIERNKEAGVDGYLLWQYAYGGVDMGSHTQYYCGVFDYFADDPVWEVIRRATGE